MSAAHGGRAPAQWFRAVAGPFPGDHGSLLDAGRGTPAGVAAVAARPRGVPTTDRSA